MAHMLDYNDEGIARFVAADRYLDKVWHREGNMMPDGIRCIDTALEAANMQYKIEKTPLFARVNGEFVEVPTHSLVYRDEDGKHLGVNGSDFRVIQPREVFDCVTDFIQGGDLTIDPLGTMHDGKRIFMSLSVAGDPLEVVPGDMVDHHLMAVDGYDGNTPLTFASVETLPVCNNTVQFALCEAKESGRLVRKRHTKNVLRSDRVDAMRKALGVAKIEVESFVNFGKELASIRMSDSEVDSFYRGLLLGDKADSDREEWGARKRRAYEELTWLYKNGPGQEIDGRKGTAWGAYNGVTAWTNHVKNYKGDVTTDRAHYVLFGTGATVNTDAAKLLVRQYALPYAA